MVQKTKRRYYRGKKNKSTLAEKVSKIQKTLAVRKPEVKYSRLYSNFSINNGPTASIFPYRNTLPGTNDDSGRIGDRIRVLNCHIKGYFLLFPTYQSTVVRTIAFIYKRNPDAITTSFSTIINLYLDSTSMNTNQAINSHRDVNNKDSFVTLYDKSQTVNQIDPVTIAPKRKFDLNLRIPKKYAQVEYADGGTSNPTCNELIIAMISDTDDLLTYYYTTQINYIDT